MVNKRRVLELMQEHGDTAFKQGYHAAKMGLPMEFCSHMLAIPEAIKRINLMVEAAQVLEIKHEEMN